jgi:hypothetical protein
MILCTADWHLDDNPENEYRWRVIDHVCAAIGQYHAKRVYVLGDAWDRKDRHSARLVNRSVDSLKRIVGLAPIVVLRGNHDKTMHDPAFWEFLNEIDGIVYLSQAEVLIEGEIMLPYTPDPMRDWAKRGIKLSAFKAAFMHVTYPGAIAENGQPLAGTKLPLHRPSLKIYSGDVHTPQRFGNFTHVGAPHPVKFGDTYRCRMLLLNDDYDVAHEIELATTQQKLMLTISDVEQLEAVNTRTGDQVKIRYNLPPGAIDHWGRIEDWIAQWARSRGIVIAATEVTINSIPNTLETEQTPEAVLRDFAIAEGLSNDTLATGLELLRQSQ